MRNNLTGGFIFMREACTRWMEDHGGAIVNIIADLWHGWPDCAHPAAVRGGMFTLCEPSDRSQPFQGFYRAEPPELLKQAGESAS